jgi:hypothetical protein
MTSQKQTLKSKIREPGTKILKANIKEETRKKRDSQ